tara:strand:- start:95 stop:862 length:768 start_codon:yes stop_codon:yes gene_type:complete
MNNKLCLITGGGSGIGRATAIKFAENKIDTIIVGRREEALVETKNLANDNSKYINFIKADISNEVGINKLYDEIDEKYDNYVNILVNNAGSSSQIRSVAHIPKKQWDEVININLNSVYLICQKFIKKMIKNKNGTIITISSMAALKPGLLGGAPYGAAKAGVTNLMGAINSEFSNDGVRATSIMPGEVDTPILNNRAKIPSKNERDTMMQPEDLAEIVFLTSNLNNRTNIETVVVNATYKRDVSEDLNAAKNKIK